MRNYIILNFVILCVFMQSYCMQAQRQHYIHQPTFEAKISSLLDNKLKGYQYSIGDQSGVLFNGAFGRAKTIEDGDVLWNNNLKMMSASIAKMVATVAISHMLDNTTVAGAPTFEDKLNLKLKDYIPIRWRSLINGNEGSVTLRHLLNHQSGFPSNTNINPKIALNGTMNSVLPSSFEYSNANFNMASFMAIYLSQPTAMSNLESALSGTTDAVYDSGFNAAIRTAYRDYAQDFVFAAIGITPECAATLNSDETDVYRYDSVTDVFGDDLGTVLTCMSNGWMLSAEDMVKFMQKWANPTFGGNILSTTAVNKINEFGSVATNSPLGWVFNITTKYNVLGFTHNGIWTSSNHLYTSEIVLTADDVYMAINVNSFATPRQTRRGLDLIDAHNDALCAVSYSTNESLMEKYNSAQEYIVTSGTTISNINETNVLKAGDYIELKPGFRAQAGCSFRAYLDDCSSAPSL